eukprot:18731_1
MNKIKQVLNNHNQSNDSNTIEKLITVRTIFGAFHHFQPNLCTKIFEDAFKNNDIIIIGDGYANKSFINFMIMFLIFVILLPFGTIKCIKFWLFEEESNVFKRIFYSIFVTIFYGICLFVIIHDTVVSCARFWDENSLKEMSEAALNGINKNADNKIKYECKCIQMEIKETTGKGNKLIGSSIMPKLAASIFVCIPQQ